MRFFFLRMFIKILIILKKIYFSNLSNNRFRVLKLDDGFEDLINLRILDISSNNYLRSPSPKYFLKKFRFLEKM